MMQAMWIALAVMIVVNGVLFVRQWQKAIRDHDRRSMEYFARQNANVPREG